MASFIKQLPLSCPGHTRPVVDVCFSGVTDCGTLFVSAGKDGKVILHQGDTGDWIGTFHGHKGAVWSCVLDKSAMKVASGATDFTARIWDVVSGTELLCITENHIVRSVDLSKCDMGVKLVTASNQKTISVYDIASTDSPLVVLNGHGDTIRRVLWCNGDRNILSVSADKSIKLWDLSVSKGEPVSTYSREMLDPITDFQFRLPSDDMHLDCVESVLTFGSTVQFCVLDWRCIRSELRDPISTFTLPCAINTASLHPTEKLLVCGGIDNFIYRLCLDSGEILETCKAHFGPLHCVRFSPDGHVFVSGSEDGTVRLWQTVVGSNFGLWKFSSSIEMDAQSKHPFSVEGTNHLSSLVDS